MRNDILVHTRILIRKWEILFAVVFRICSCSCICICGLYLNFLFGIFYLKLYLASHFPDNFNAIWLEITNHGGQHQIPELTLRGSWPITTSPGFNDHHNDHLNFRIHSNRLKASYWLSRKFRTCQESDFSRARGRISCSRSWNISSLKDKNPEKTNSRILD